MNKLYYCEVLLEDGTFDQFLVEKTPLYVIEFSESGYPIAYENLQAFKDIVGDFDKYAILVEL